MGCACIQQDMVIRNQRINKQQNISEVNSGRQNEDIRQKNFARSPNNEPVSNVIQPQEIINENIPSNNNPRNIQQINVASQPVRNHNIIQSLQFNNRIGLQGEIYLQSRFNPDFNYPEIGKLLFT
jgi:hypothetical protein